MKEINNSKQESSAVNGTFLKQFEVCIASTQLHNTIVLVTAEDQEEAKAKALRWEVDDILDTYKDGQEDEIADVEEVNDHVNKVNDSSAA